MTEREIKMLVNDELSIINALLKTANIAISNLEYFGTDGQSVAITLDVVSTRLDECQKRLDMIRGRCDISPSPVQTDDIR